ncbi:hypothetical protein AALO_G00257980 [Alosa alosa]|uniref:non-specific serine/threonine protein kinase n=1 Tax=Alosa alosa TaxID=278164 RepID=A0AAV6FPI0_9TELE|nr:testis-specific serine/threonine-protein kinase 5-like [Alosa alosa]KAG5264783.1 hypothetical protein AALO_G00257980 [Alosa alosa]
MRSSKVRETKPSLQEKAYECRKNGYLLSSKRIGTGAFSKVYLGYATPSKICQNYKLSNDLRSKKHNMVAIKIISINQSLPEYSKKFLHREIHALNATYQHPSVIQLYDMFHTLTRVYLVLELALRGDLLEHINAVSQSKGTPGLSEEEACGIFQQIVSAVKHCHSNHIVHRDLKCENILLDEGGFVKVTDFGFANSYIDKKALMSTFCGSVAYTAPEILMSQKYNGEMADLWSLGVILYAMVTGKLPYQEKNPRKLVQLFRKELPFHTPVSSACQDLIVRLLQWHPSTRLPLDQISRHPWMSPPSTTDLPCKLRVTKSDITDRSKTPENKFRNASPTAKTGRTCQSGPGTPIPGTTPFTRSNTTLAEGPPRVPGGRRLGASSTDSRRTLPKREDRKEEPAASMESPYRLLKRPTVDQVSNPNQLFFARPRPPMMPKPFHNLPNFRKPGHMPPHELGNHKQLYKPSERLPQSTRPPRTPMKIPTTGF